jgi:hypothetical protein
MQAIRQLVSQSIVPNGIVDIALAPGGHLSHVLGPGVLRGLLDHSLFPHFQFQVLLPGLELKGLGLRWLDSPLLAASAPPGGLRVHGRSFLQGSGIPGHVIRLWETCRQYLRVVHSTVYNFLKLD